MKNKLIITAKKLPYFFGFLIMYVIPIILFGNIIPYTRAEIPAGLTKAGYFAIAILILIILSKLKQKILQQPKSVLRGAALSAFPLLFWLIVKIGIDYVERAVISFSNYWDKIIIFIIIGRLFYCIGEIVNAETVNKEEKENGK